LFPTRQGTHFILVNKRMQRGARAHVGTTVQVQLEPDTEERVVEIPAELKRATRLRRSEQVAEQLLSAMEAERELPPAIRLAFARNPQAREGWEQMSAIRRRQELLAIFHYRTPESRARRLAKAVEEAAALAEKKARRGKP
jgi:uncharacterized protein YdeI (YjbR/CyaY-like superfamily)